MVEIISSDAVEDERLGLVYHMRVRLAQSAIGEAALAPGMAVTADIRTGRRSLLSYLISPLDAVRREAGRER